MIHLHTLEKKLAPGHKETYNDVVLRELIKEKRPLEINLNVTPKHTDTKIDVHVME